MLSELEELVRSIIRSRCETQTLEIKAAKDGAPHVYDSLSSFSNQNDGGIILFGIDESEGFEVCGVYDAQDLQKKLHGQCEAMTPRVRPVFEVAQMDGKTVVAMYITGRSMSERPAYRTIKGIPEGSYTRIGDADVRMTATELYEIQSFKEGRRDDVDVDELASITMLDSAKVSRFIDAAARERPLLERRSRDEMLSLLGIMRDGKPTLAGMMTLGDYPQQVYPNLCITAIAVNGTELLHHDSEERFIDNKRYEGTIDEMIEGVMGFVTRNSKTKVVIRDGKRADVAQYPQTAVREIVVNALMHRDYGPYCNGTPIRLVLFSDRLECWNPGGIYGGQSINELGIANMPTRNPTLVSILEIEKIAENRHSGIPVIRDEARSYGLREPEFVDHKGSFLVRFFNEAVGNDDAVDVNTTDRRRKKARPSNKIIQDILEYCSQPRSAQEITDSLGYNIQYVRKRYIRPMVDDGRLALTMPDKPQSKFQRYRAA
ncbi:MAG: putative DNA binding domain-containing protein [Bifidobacterium tibiigranuli]|jgi:predicted HTH transcriptional regulator|uniref:ATP-binding protein n=1 Tax=Bifidobacterium tibiigranuli TaxID=2172043 RepID=UPI0026F03E4C|nr:ATP-binding protein [Bifidobacterium tibiigranuli]MCI1674518.1 putative DNA binding domain-containing protein [Bifidobacterium tibiigranuli]MCI1713083.1 putative DNA binding domain-containing protein [Bifidobacterium tibiigranuli]